MKNNIRLVSLLIIGLFSALASQAQTRNKPARVLGSPYPYSAQPDTLYLYNPSGVNDSANLAVETLQGLLAKTKPKIYQIHGSGYALWIADLMAHGVKTDSAYMNDYKGLIKHFSSRIQGYVLCHPDDSTANTAISVCGVTNAIAVSTADTALMDTLHIPLLYDVRQYGAAWTLLNFDTSFNKRVITYQVESKDLLLGDYSVFAGALHFFSPITSSITTTAFTRMTAQSALFGWGTDEHSLVATASQHAINVHAADWASNISTLTNFNIPPITQNTHGTDTQTIANRHTVCFTMTDGDNMQWLLGDFMGSNQWYGNPNRGNNNIGWTVSPAMAEVAPTVLRYFYQHATPKDYFIAAASGLGYIYPDNYPQPALDSNCSLLNRFMAKADLNIVNILGNSSASQYMIPYLNQSNVDAIFYYDYSNYSGLNGKITCINGKPVIGGRYNLWSGFETPASLAAKLNQQAKNPYSQSGYSLIPVHVWSNNVDSVNKCISLLDSTVRVVAPDVFVKLITRNVCNPSATHDIKSNDKNIILFPPSPNPFTSTTEISYYLPAATPVDITVENMLGQQVQILVKATISEGFHTLKLNAEQLTPGMYICKLKVLNAIYTQKCVLIR